MSFALSLSAVSKVYPTGVEALKKVDLNIKKGDFFALLGPNGAGKTSLIGILSGLVPLSSGTVHIFGQNQALHPSETKMKVGLVPQEFNFNIFEKVIDIVVTQGGYFGIPYREAVQRAEVLLKDLGLWEKRNSQSRTLSGGMKRRLMIARALIHDPDLLILDEPTAGVDVELRREMWDYLKAMNEAGKTIVLTTHYLEEAEQLAKNVAIIRQGEIVRQGAMKDLLRDMEKKTYIFHFEDGTFEECVFKAGDSVVDQVQKFLAMGRKIVDLGPKMSRLEELFLDLLK